MMLKLVAKAAVAALFAITLLIIKVEWLRLHWPYVAMLWVPVACLWFFAFWAKTAKLPSIQTVPI
jgi:hypothetical protein